MMTLDELNQYRFLESEIAEIESRVDDDPDKDILEKRLNQSRDLKREIEEYISNCPDSLTRQILTRRFVKGDSWVKVSMDIYKGLGTEATVKAIAYRYISSKCNEESD